MKNVVIEKISYIEAPIVVKNEEIESKIIAASSKFGFEPGWFENLTGIYERRMWPSDLAVSDIAVLSAKDVINKAGIDKNDIGCIINCSVSLDYGEPTISIVVHDKLGLSQTCVPFDVANACMGFSSAFDIISNMVKLNQIKYGLIVAGENGARLLDNTIKFLNKENVTFNDLQSKFAALTIGSGSVAMLVCSEEIGTSGHIVNGSVSVSDSRFWKHCVGALDRSWLTVDAANMMRDGIDVLQLMEQELIKRLPTFNDDDIDIYIPHQISKRHNDVLCDVTSISKEKLFVTYPYLGNIGPASWPISLEIADKEGAIKKGDLVGIASMGSGFNCSCISVTW